jgi:hypothetical protein
MRVANYLIDKEGVLIYPTSQLNIENDAKHNIINTQITLVFYSGIVTNPDGSISGTGVVTTGLSGTVNVQARSDIDDRWSDIDNGNLDISTSNRVYPAGVIQSVNLITNEVAGCEYIGVIVDTNL